nr:uncharacterized protein LOC127338814 [Lolium perenne]
MSGRSAASSGAKLASMERSRSSTAARSPRRMARTALQSSKAMEDARRRRAGLRRLVGGRLWVEQGQEVFEGGGGGSGDELDGWDIPRSDVTLPQLLDQIFGTGERIGWVLRPGPPPAQAERRTLSSSLAPFNISTASWLGR